MLHAGGHDPCDLARREGGLEGERRGFPKARIIETEGVAERLAQVPRTYQKAVDPGNGGDLRRVRDSGLRFDLGDDQQLAVGLLQVIQRGYRAEAQTGLW